MNDLALLLSEIAGISKKYEKISDILGDRFNIFGILNLKTDELSHSKFIAELLDPKGSHGKNKFLDLFLEKIGEKDFYRKDDLIRVETEKPIGYVTSDSGGRIDIFINNNKNPKQIIIENKIYAGDQPNQLLRYRNYDPTARLIYLTLDGRDAENAKEIEYTKLSYSDDIIPWLEECKKEAVNFPILRETLTQYILLVKDLTGSNEMKNEYLDVILKNGENFAAALDIANNITEAKRRAIADRFIPALEQFAKKSGLELSLDEGNYFKQGWGFTFKKGGLYVDFEFQAFLKKPLYGIGYKLPKETPKELKEYVERLGYNCNENYLLFRYLNSNFEQLLFKKMYNLEEIISVIEAKIKELEELYKGRLKEFVDLAL
jgi:hypothetical protein